MFFDDYFNLYWNDDKCYDIANKQFRTRELVLYMLNRTQQIFTWSGLPETIPSHNLEFLLQTCGSVCITDVTEVPEGRGNTGLYAFFGGLGGELNAYYEPTIYTVANPWLNFNKELLIDTDCIRGRNDKNSLGLIPLFIRYASMQNENEISMNMLAINYRIDNLISADNDQTYESAKKFINDIIAGKFGAISASEFFEGIRNDKVGGSGKNIKDLIEYEQYLKASWYNEIGLNSNYNMKRERIVASEAEMTDDALIPLVDNMLEWRTKLCNDVKEMYGDKYNLDDLSVALNPVWDLDRMYVGMLPEEAPEDISERSEENEVIDNVISDTDDSTISSDDTDTDNSIEVNENENISTDGDNVSDNNDGDITVNINIETSGEVTVESEENENGNISEEKTEIE